MSPRSPRRRTLWLGGLGGGPIFKGSSALSVSVLIVALGGALFWAIAARSSSSETVGRVAALTSTVAVLVFLTALGLIPVVARFGSSDEPEARVIHNLALVSASVFALAIAGTVAVASRAADVRAFEAIHSGPGAVAFVLVSIGAAFTVLVEIRLLSQRRYRWIIGRALVTAVVSVTLVSWGAVSDRPLLIFLSGAGVAALSGPLIWWLSERRTSDRYRCRPLPRNFSVVLRYLAVSWTGSLVGKAAGTALPLVVALSVSAEDNARFFVAWNIALVMFLLIQNVGTTLLADGGRTSPLVDQTRHSLVLGATLAGVLAIAALGGAPLVVRVYGPEYAGAVDVFRLLALAAIPTAFYVVAIAVAQVRNLARVILGLPALLTASVYLPLALMAPKISITSVAAVWCVGATIAGAAGAVVLFGMSRLSDPADPNRPLEILRRVRRT